MIPFQALAKYTFPVTIYFLNIKIDFYSFYKKNLITALKYEEQLIDQYTRLWENDDCSLSRAKPHH